MKPQWGKWMIFSVCVAILFMAIGIEAARVGNASFFLLIGAVSLLGFLYMRHRCLQLVKTLKGQRLDAEDQGNIFMKRFGLCCFAGMSMGCCLGLAYMVHFFGPISV